MRQLQIQSPGLVRKNLNQVTAALNQNPFFWGGDATGWTGYNGTFAVVSDPPDPAPYPYAGLFTISTAGVGAAAEESGAYHLVVPGQQYLLSAWVYTSAA